MELKILNFIPILLVKFFFIMHQANKFYFRNKKFQYLVEKLGIIKNNK